MDYHKKKIDDLFELYISEEKNINKYMNYFDTIIHVNELREYIANINNNVKNIDNKLIDILKCYIYYKNNEYDQMKKQCIKTESKYKCGYGYYILGLYREKVGNIFDIDKYYIFSGKAGCGYGYYYLAENLLYGVNGREKNIPKGIKYLKMAMNLDCGKAYFCYGLFDEITTKNKKESIEYYRIAGELGYGRAYADLGLKYEQGITVEQSDKMAFEYYNIASKLGCGNGYNHIGIFYECGSDEIKLEKDMKKASENYRLAKQFICTEYIDYQE
jgi:TPR repeat protein